MGRATQREMAGICSSLRYRSYFFQKKSITSNDHSFGHPIYTDTIYNAILSTDTSTMLDTTELIL